MPMKLTVGFSKKEGLPNYSSLGVSCGLEMELDGQMLSSNFDKFQQEVQNAYLSCSVAVHNELTNQKSEVSPQPQQKNNSDWEPAGSNPSKSVGNSQPAVQRRLATFPQIGLIRRLADERSIDLEKVLREDFHVDDPQKLSIGEASELIDVLRRLTDQGGLQSVELQTDTKSFLE